MILAQRSTHRNVRRVSFRMRGIQSRGFEADRGPNGFENEHETFQCPHCFTCETVPQPGCTCPYCARFPNMLQPSEVFGHCKRCDRMTCVKCSKIGACARELKEIDSYVNKQHKGY